jgi:glycosyltransferase involved in cell wall biosynthesis
VRTLPAPDLSPHGSRISYVPSPAVSIVLPTYDRLEYLKEAVGSVLAQTFTDWELIVVDDGSTDDTRRWLAAISDPRVVVVPLGHTGNRSLVRNCGVARARGSWIAFLDSDDLWAPEKLAIQLEHLASNPTRRWSCTAVSFIDGRGLPTAQRAGPPYRAQSGWILEGLLRFTAAATMPTLVVHRSLFDEVGGFDESVLEREDYELELRLAARSEIHALADVLTIVRQHDGRTSGSRRVADLYRANETVFRKVARTTDDKKIKSICRRQCAVQLTSQARALSHDGEHWAALMSSGRAIRETPFTRGVWRSAAGCTIRWLSRHSRAAE